MRPVGVEDRVPGRPAGGDCRPGRPRFFAVAVEELADVDRLVAVRLQPGREVVGERAAEREPDVAAVGRDVPLDVVVVGIAPGQEADPRGAAEGVGDVVAVEGDPLLGDQVERRRHRPRLRRPGVGAGGGVEAVERLVVGLDHDEVRRVRVSRGAGAAAGRRGEQQREHGQRRPAATAGGRVRAGKFVSVRASQALARPYRHETPAGREVAKR